MSRMTESSIWFRHRMAARKRPPSWVSRLAYPLFVLAPGLLLMLRKSEGCCTGGLDWTAVYLTLFLHVFYFAARTLGSTVGAVTRERERQTFESLQGTNTTPREVLGGLFTIAVLPRLGELVLFSPLLLVLYPDLVEPVEWLKLVAVSAALVVGYAALGLASSAASRTTVRSGQLAFGALALCFLGTFWFDAVFDELRLVDSLFLTLPLNPLVSIASIMDPFDSDWGNWAWLTLTLTHLAAATALMRVALHGLLRPERTVSSPRPGTRLRLGARSEHPVLFRELHLKGRLWVYPLIVLTPPMTFALLKGDPRGLLTGIHVALFLHLLYFSLQAVSRSVTAVSSEREHRTLESLLSTQLTGRELYRGKLAAVMAPLLLEQALFSPILLAFAGVERLTLLEMLGLEVITTVTILGLASLGLWASARFPTSTRAAQVTMAVVGAAFVGGVIVDILLAEMGGGGELFLGSVASPLMAFVTFLWEREHVHVWLGGPLLSLMAAGWLSRATAGHLKRLAG